MPTHKHHKCPSPSCLIEVPNTRFACRTHWFALSADTREAVTRTARLPLLNPERWDAINTAIEELA